MATVKEGQLSTLEQWQSKWGVGRWPGDQWETESLLGCEQGWQEGYVGEQVYQEGDAAFYGGEPSSSAGSHIPLSGKIDKATSLGCQD